MKTISKAILIGATTLNVLGLVACSGGSGSNTTSTIKNQQYHNVKINLSGEVRDGATNAALEDVKITLIQGSSIRHTTTKKSTEPGQKGIYTINDIPATVVYRSFAGNGELSAQVNEANTYKMVVSKKGYRTLETDMSFSVQGVKSNQLQNAVRYKLEKIILYPETVVPADIKVRLYFNGTPIADKDVILKVTTASTVAGTMSQAGYVANVIAKTDADGIATFKGNTLFAGATYKAYLMPTTIDIKGQTVQLAYSGSGPVNAGRASGTILGLEASAANNNADTNLYIVKANNDEEGKVEATGKLVVTFNEDITLMSGKFADIDDTCVGNSYQTDPLATTPTKAALGDISGTNTNNLTVTVAGNVLTVTPNFANGKAPANAGYDVVAVNYATGGSCDLETKIVVKGKSAHAVATLNDIKNSLGGTGLYQKKVYAKNK